MKSLVGLLMIGAVFIAGVLLVQRTVIPEEKVCFQETTCLWVRMADTESEHEQGLSGKWWMHGDVGMWFRFSRPQMLAFWMKDMNFGLDFVWLRDGQVVDIAERVKRPQAIAEEEEILTPRERADGVIEVNQGWVQRYGVEIGDQLN